MEHDKTDKDNYPGRNEPHSFRPGLLVDKQEWPVPVESRHPRRERLLRERVVLRNVDSVKGLSFSAKRLNGIDLRSAGGQH